MEKFKLMKPNLEYKQEAIKYIREFERNNENPEGPGNLSAYISNYELWLEKLEIDRNVLASEERVPAETFFLVRKEDNKIIGMIDVKLVLNKKLREYGGNIGYNIRPTERRKGYNKINLYLALKFCQTQGLKEVILATRKENIGSWKTMEALGGKCIKEYYDEKNVLDWVKRYEINVEDSLIKYEKEYKKLIWGKE